MESLHQRKLEHEKSGGGEPDVVTSQRENVRLVPSSAFSRRARWRSSSPSRPMMETGHSRVMHTSASGGRRRDRQDLREQANPPPRRAPHSAARYSACDARLGGADLDPLSSVVPPMPTPQASREIPAPRADGRPLKSRSASLVAPGELDAGRASLSDASAPFVASSSASPCESSATA